MYYKKSLPKYNWVFKCTKCKKPTDSIYTANNNADRYCPKCYEGIKNEY